MLQSITIQNYAIIDSLRIDFSPQLNVMTGETGAGKSIIVGALSLILGERAEAGMLRDYQQKCVIEGNFLIKGYDLQDIFATENLDYADETIIRREILPSGKSRSFVNDTPASLKSIRELATHLVDLHRQFETSELNTNDYQLMVADSVAANDKLLSTYKACYKEWQSAKTSLIELEESQARALNELDYSKFQLKELEEISLEELDQNSLEDELNMLNHAEEIKSKLLRATGMLSEGESSISDQLGEVSGLLRQLKDFDTGLASLYDRYESAFIEINDISKELQHKEQGLVHDRERTEEIQQLLNILYRLQKKHGLQDTASLQKLRDELAEKVHSFEHLDEHIEQQRKKLVQLELDLLKKGQELFEKRSKMISPIEEKMHQLLAKVGMANARFKVQHEKMEKGKFNENGIDELNFLFSANPGTELREIRKVASGGEMSRLMLCVKSLLADTVALPTLIFDEIDTGISGPVAGQVGTILKEMGAHHQIISITHLPQIAAKGNSHYHIYKEVSAGMTQTRVKKLNEKERVEEIALMLGGTGEQKAALANAKELLSLK